VDKGEQEADKTGKGKVGKERPEKDVAEHELSETEGKDKSKPLPHESSTDKRGKGERGKVPETIRTQAKYRVAVYVCVVIVRI
jgi:hypothetical protein